MKLIKLPTRGQAWKNNSAKYHSNPALILKCLDDYDRFDKFMDLDLKLGMFIPCKDGVPLKKPEKYHFYLKSITNGETVEWINQCKEYNKAESEVIFEGFEMEIMPINAIITNNGFTVGSILHKGEPFNPLYKSISDLAGKVDLNKNGQTKSGLI